MSQLCVWTSSLHSAKEVGDRASPCLVPEPVVDMQNSSDAGQSFKSLVWTYAVLSMSLMWQWASTYMPRRHLETFRSTHGYMYRALRPHWPIICSKGARQDY